MNEQIGLEEEEEEEDNLEVELKQEEQEDNCRICFDGREIATLFSPCHCRGSSRFIHIHCLEEWRKQGQRQFFECSTCLYKYRFSRIFYAKLLSSSKFITFVTLFVIIFSIAFVGFALKFSALLFLGLRLGRSAFSLTDRLIWWSMLLIGFVTAILSLFNASNNENGAGGRIVMDIIRSFGDTSFNSPSIEILGYTMSFTGFGLFIVRVYQFVRSYFNQLLTKCGQRILDISES